MFVSISKQLHVVFSSRLENRNNLRVNEKLQTLGFGQLTDLRSCGVKIPAAASLMAVAKETQKKKGEQI